MALTVPTGPAAFSGASYLPAPGHYTTLQPYLGFQWQKDRFYIIGFSAVNVATGPRDVTFFFNDLAIGYCIYLNPDLDGLIRAIAPMFESHVNTPLNHRDEFDPRDVAGTADVVDLTEGANLFLGRRPVLSLGIVTPVTGPRPDSLEALAYLNVFF